MSVYMYTYGKGGRERERGEMECVLGFLKRGESGAGYLEEVKSVCEYCRQRLERRQAKAEQVGASSNCLL